MKTMSRIAFALVAALAFAGCGDKHDDHAGHGHGEGDHDHTAKNGGVLLETSDHSMHFEVSHDEGAGLLKVWVYDGKMAEVSTAAPSIQLASDSGGKKLTGQNPAGAAKAHEWHFSDRALNKHVHGRLRLEHEGKSYNVDLPEDEHAHDDDHDHAHDGDHEGHEHDDHEGIGPNDGMVAAFKDSSGNDAGHLELKLHDDKGDLELWLAKDKGMKRPFDLELDAEITIKFPDMQKRIVLKVRNRDKNEDESGTATVRRGRTNYFIFPGETGADASWLMGKKFSTKVTVHFADNEADYATEAFVLVPHSHDDGHEHK